MDAVADAEDGDAEVKDGFVGQGGVLGKDGVGAAGEDDANDAVFFQGLGGRGVVVDFGVNLALADAAGDDLRVLGTEIEDGDGL